MKPRRDGITALDLKSILSYDPTSGRFVWRVKIGSKLAGTIAGCQTVFGYNRITICRREYRSARLAWLYMTGVWPTNEVDHRDGNRLNDSWQNLREADRVENGSNRKFSGTNASGFKGVVWLKHRQKWAARIRHRGVTRDVGYSHDPKEAARFYDRAAKRLHGEFCRLNFNNENTAR